MALADTARLAVQLDLKGNFGAQLRSNQKLLGNFDASVSKTQSRAFKAGQQIGTGIKRGAVIAAGAVGLLATQVVAGLHSLEELETVTSQTNAVLKSTKGVAGQTAESIRNLAEKYEGLNATIDDKVIQSAENVLLTFTAVRKQAFEPAIKAALDMSTALGTDLQGSVIQIGKALQDPIKGITALRRVGVNFSADQIKVIKRLVETGNVLGAQKLILKELNTEFGGSFLAGGNTTAGKVAKFKDAIEDLERSLATALLPTIGKIADALSKFLADPKVIRGVEDLGKSIASLFSDANLKQGADFLKGAFETAKSAAPVVAQAARTTFGFVQAAVGLFKQLPPQLQGLLVGGFAVNKLTGGLVTNIAGGIIDAVGKNVFQRGSSAANPLWVTSATGVPGLGPTGPEAATGVAGFLKGAAKLAGGVGIAIIGIEAFGALINATSTKEQQATTAQNIQDAERRKHQIGGAPPPHSSNTPSTVVQGGFNAAYGVNSVTAGGFDPRLIKDLNVTMGGFDKRLAGAGSKVKAVLDAIHQQLVTANSTLKTSKDPKAIAAAAVAAAKSITKGVGNVDTTNKTLANLKNALKNTHDPKTAAALRAAIHKVESKIPGREYAQRQINKANQILHSSESSKQKITELKRIEQQLKDHGLPHAAAGIQDKINAAKRAQVAAEHATAQAVKNKDLSVTVHVEPPRVSLTTIINGTRLVSSYGGNKKEF